MPFSIVYKMFALYFLWLLLNTSLILWLRFSEVAVRAELMEQVPHIAMLYHNKRNSLHHLINDTLLPLVTKFLADEDNQVQWKHLNDWTILP